jgi:cysteine desulfurase
MVDLQGPPFNPSSVHSLGKKGKDLLTQSRAKAASFFAVKPEEIIFTSSGTESINLMLKGLEKKGHIITTTIEHSAIAETIKCLEEKGNSVSWLTVGLDGAPTVSQIEEAIRSDTIAIVLSLSNSETGVQIDLAKIADLAEKKGIYLLIDAVAFIGKEALIMYPGISALALSGHKFHAPKGSALLFARKNFPLIPLVMGGGQEFKHRSGTENLAAILGLAKGLEIVQKNQLAITEKILHLRLYFESELKKAIVDLEINGLGNRICNTTNLFFPGIDGETFLIQLDLNQIAASLGSACSSGALQPSRILTQMGIPWKKAKSSIRFSFSRMNTKEEIDRALEIICKLSKALGS